jgi:hypothetical protein
MARPSGGQQSSRRNLTDAIRVIPNYGTAGEVSAKLSQGLAAGGIVNFPIFAPAHTTIPPVTYPHHQSQRRRMADGRGRSTVLAPAEHSGSTDWLGLLAFAAGDLRAVRELLFFSLSSNSKRGKTAGQDYKNYILSLASGQSSARCPRLTHHWP